MSRRRNSGGEGHGGEERWLLPYADMITLLLGLFIVLFAMSTLDAKKFENVKRSLSEVFNGQITTESGDVLDGSSSVLDPTSTSQPPSQQSIQRATDAKAASKQQYDRQAKQLKQVAQQAGLTAKDVRIIQNERGIVIRLAGDALFDSGQSTLKPGVKDKLRRLEMQLAKFNRELEIVGHTDGAPYRYPGGNWYLGMDRALAVTMFFIEQDYPGEKLYPKTRANFDPVKDPPKGNPQASMAENRRIEILVLAPAANVPGSSTQKIATAVDLVAHPGAGGVGGATIQNPADIDIASELAITAKAVQG